MNTGKANCKKTTPININIKLYLCITGFSKFDMHYSQRNLGKKTTSEPMPMAEASHCVSIRCRVWIRHTKPTQTFSSSRKTNKNPMLNPVLHVHLQDAKDNHQIMWGISCLARFQLWRTLQKPVLAEIIGHPDRDWRHLCSHSAGDNHSWAHILWMKLP